MESRTRVQVVPPLLPRKRDAHKGDFGRVLIVAGSVGMSGAAALSAGAALRGGAGLVRVACAEPILPIVAASDPCVMTVALPAGKRGRIDKKAAEKLREEMHGQDVVAIGPGMGRSDGLVELIGELVDAAACPLVIDADGLNNLSKIEDWPARCKTPVVITPHPGEMSRLESGAGLDEAIADRGARAARFAKWSRQTVVLKGADTVVCDGERIYFNTTGNPGMATAGSGDVLTGLIAACIGQRFSPFDAAVLGVFLHGHAGDLAAAELGEISMTARDIIDHLPRAIRAHQMRSAAGAR